jgi:hypothetical protein
MPFEALALTVTTISAAFKLTCSTASSEGIKDEVRKQDGMALIPNRNSPQPPKNFIKIESEPNVDPTFA